MRKILSREGLSAIALRMKFKMILQIYVEKKKEFDSPSSRLLYLISKNVSISSATELRIFEKYVVEYANTADYDLIKSRILSDPVIENVYIDFLPADADFRSIAIKLPEGQNDVRLENMRRCFELCGVMINRKLSRSAIISVGNNPTVAMMNEIKNSLITAGYELDVESIRKNEQKKEKHPKKRTIDGFIKMNDIDVYQFHRKNKLKMSSVDFCAVRDYYKALGRDPLWLEARVIDSCFANVQPELLTVLDKIDIKESDLNIPVTIALDEYITARGSLYGSRNVPITLNDIAAIGLMALKQRGQATDIERSVDGNIQIQLPVDVDGVYEQWALTLKGTKSTEDCGFDCIGDMISEHLPDKTLAYQSLGLNCIGVDNVKDGKTDFTAIKMNNAASDAAKHASVASTCKTCVVTNSERMNLRFTVSAAAAPKSNLHRMTCAEGDTVILLGGRLHSCDLPQDGIIQRQNPQIMQAVKKLICNQKAAAMIKKCADLKHGLANAVIELAPDGAVISVDRVVGDNIVDIALALSEPCERVAVLCERANAKRFMGLARQYGIESHNVAVADESQYLRFYMRDEQLAALELKFLKYRGEIKKSDVIIAAPHNLLKKPLNEEFCKLPITEAFVKNLSANNYNDTARPDCRFDWTSGAVTVTAPMGGKYQATPEESFSCKIPAVGKSTNTVTVMSVGAASKITAVSPFHGAAFSIMESISKIVASGGNSLDVKLALCEHFIDPATAPIKWSEPVGAMLGAFEAQVSMGLPVVDNTASIEPVGNFKSAFTFASFAVASAKSNEIISASFKNAGSSVLLIPMPIVPKTGMPDFDKAKVLYRQFHYLSQSSKIISASVVKEGGAAAAVAKMSFGNRIGFEFETADFDTLFGDNIASIIVETNTPGAFSGMDTVLLGKTVRDECFIFDGNKISLNDAYAAYSKKNEKGYYRIFAKNVTMANIDLNATPAAKYSGDKLLKPRVIIPTFGSSVGDTELYNRFERTGGAVDDFVFDYRHIPESRETLASLIEKSQIIALPDSDSDRFSRNLPIFAMSDDKVLHSLQSFLSKGGLILGVGGGFYTLIKMGLLGVQPNSVSLAPNITANEISAIVKTRVTSVKSPWLNLCEAGSVYSVAANHSCGRFVADEATISLLSAGGRITTQYVDNNGKPTAKRPYNPNGSTAAIESICSQSGAVLGKMCLPERYSDGCYANVDGTKDMLLFKSGVQYFM